MNNNVNDEEEAALLDERLAIESLDHYVHRYGILHANGGKRTHVFNINIKFAILLTDSSPGTCC